MRRARKKPSVTAEFIATWRRLALPTTEATNLAKSRDDSTFRGTNCFVYEN